MSSEVSNDKLTTVVAWFYIVAGVIGAIIITWTLFRSTIGFVTTIAWLLLLVQTAAAISGGLGALKGRELGYQLLYWVSLSCIPLFETPAIDYYSVIGFGFIPNFTIGSGISAVNFPVRFGYEGNLAFFSSGNYLTLGVNVVALALTFHMRKVLNAAGIKRWPLRNAASQPAA